MTSLIMWQKLTARMIASTVPEAADGRVDGDELKAVSVTRCSGRPYDEPYDELWPKLSIKGGPA